MKFKNSQGPKLYSRTLHAIKMKNKNSRTFKDLWKPVVNATAMVQSAKLAGDFT